jgi:hypothetical protein
MLGTFAIVVLVPALLLTALSPAIVQLYGRSFAVPSKLLILLIVASALTNLGGGLYTCLLSFHGAWLGLLGNLLWAAGLLVSFRLLIDLRATGLAWAQVLSYSIALFTISPPILIKLFRSAEPPS